MARQYKFKTKSRSRRKYLSWDDLLHIEVLKCKHGLILGSWICIILGRLYDRYPEDGLWSLLDDVADVEPVKIKLGEIVAAAKPAKQKVNLGCEVTKERDIVEEEPEDELEVFTLSWMNLLSQTQVCRYFAVAEARRQSWLQNYFWFNRSYGGRWYRRRSKGWIWFSWRWRLLWLK